MLKRILAVAIATLVVTACGSSVGSLIGIEPTQGVQNINTQPAPRAAPTVEVIQENIPLIKAPTEPYKTRPTPESLGLVSIGDDYFCPAQAVNGKREQVWKRPGAHPYSGTVGQAIGLLRDVPKEVRAAWQKNVNADVFTSRTLKEGERFCSMFYTVDGKNTPTVVDEKKDDGWWPSWLRGRMMGPKDPQSDASRSVQSQKPNGNSYHRIWSNIKNGEWVNKPGAKNGALVVSVEHGGYIWELIVPEVCDNVSYVVRPILKPLMLAPEPTPQKAEPVTGETAPAAPVMTPAHKQLVKDRPGFFYRVTFWRWDSISVDLQNEIKEVMLSESNDTYALAGGAVSRDIGPKLFTSWEKGGATTVKVPSTVSVKYTNSGDWKSVSANIGDHPAFPDLVFWEEDGNRVEALTTTSNFELRNPTAEGCTLVYPTKRMKYALSYRLNAKGALSEVGQLASTEGPIGDGANLHVIMDCP
ncbi:hypothetical protein ACFL6I_05525 [candidate division KSB1 bacterium]